ncbi:MAG: hypothetical protein [Olavius algarvensis Gamma 1 endosymbiont]|nr:MAG: hypothetical protein [Olavius algarvensis Gamma 1 endosymbiont]
MNQSTRSLQKLPLPIIVRIPRQSLNRYLPWRITQPRARRMLPSPLSVTPFQG